MTDSAALLEMRRRQHVMRKRREALERIAANCGEQAASVRRPLIARAQPVQDYPHDTSRDIFGIGGYGDSRTSRMKIDDMIETLRFAADAGNSLLPEVYNALRRRDRLLRNNLMYMGPLTAFADYFPLLTTATYDPEEPGGRRCDICKAMPPPISTHRDKAAWM